MEEREEKKNTGTIDPDTDNSYQIGNKAVFGDLFLTATLVHPIFPISTPHLYSIHPSMSSLYNYGTSLLPVSIIPQVRHDTLKLQNN